MRSEDKVGPKTGELAGVTLLGVSVDTARGRLVGLGAMEDGSKTRFREDVRVGKDGAGIPLLFIEALFGFLSAFGVGDMGVATMDGRSVTVYRSKASKRVGIRSL